MPANLRDRRVVVVEDEYFIAEEVVAALQRADAEVAGPVGTLDEAIRLLLGDDGIHLAVLDIKLHGDRSFEIARLLAARRIPFLFATGYNDVILPPDQCGVPIWGKPFDTAALAAALIELGAPAIASAQPADAQPAE